MTDTARFFGKFEMYYGPILPQQKWSLDTLLARCRQTTPYSAVFYSGNPFTCIYSICFLLSHELAFPKVGTFPGWCSGLEATFLGSQCIDQCFYLITLIVLKIILALLFPATVCAILNFLVLFSSQNCTSFIPFCFGLSISISINTETSYHATECLLCCLAIFSDKLLAYCDFNLI